MSDETLKDNLLNVMSLSFTSSIVLGFALIVFGIYQDYIFYTLYEIFTKMQSTGLFGSWVLTIMEQGNEVFLQIPLFLDILWVVVFVWYIGELFVHSYQLKRQDYNTTISFIVIGSMLYMFLSGIYLTLSNWFIDEIVLKFLPNIMTSTPFFSMYLSYAGIINLLLFFGLVIANFVDLDFSSFNVRKNREMKKDDDEVI